MSTSSNSISTSYDSKAAEFGIYIDKKYCDPKHHFTGFKNLTKEDDIYMAGDSFYYRPIGSC
jgi:hypothetical protein